MAAKRFRASFWIFCLLGVAAVGVVFAVLFSQNKQDVADATKKSDETRLRLLGLDGPPKEHKLDPRFQDANGDLIADTPADPAKLLDPDTLTFSYVATESPGPEIYEARWKDFTDHLSTVTGKPVKYVQLKRTDDELRAMQDGKLLVAGFNSGAVPAAVNRSGFVPAYQLGKGAGPYCQIIVPADSPMSSPADLKGRTLVFVDLSSNTGFKAPVFMLKQQFNMLPYDANSFDVVFSYGHETSINGIAKKQYQAAAVASDMLERAIASKTIAPGDFKVIYKSDRFPTAALGFAYNLKPELQAKVRKAFETYPWPDGPLKQEFAPADQAKFTATNYKDDWQTIRKIDDALGTN